MRGMFRFLSGTKSIQRKLFIIFVSVSIPLLSLLFYVQHLSEKTILNHIEEIDDMRMAETSTNIRDLLNRIFMSTNLFISDPMFIESLQIADPFNIEKTNIYFHTIDRLQYAFFLNESYAVAIMDKYGNQYVSETSRLHVSKEAVRRMMQEQIPDERLSIMDSYRWYILDIPNLDGQDESFIVLSRILFNPETAVPKGQVIILMPFSYILNILERQQGYFELWDADGNVLYRSAEADNTGGDSSEAELYPLQPATWSLHYWADSSAASERISLFRLTTYVAIGTIMVLLIGVTALVINEIRKALLQIRSLSKQLIQHNDTDIMIKGDYHIVELSHTLRQLVHNLNTARKNYESEAHAKKQLEMQMLQHQINPHFLLNTLNTFRWLAEDARQHKLSSLMLALSYLLKQQLYDERSYWTVAEEVQYIKKYIEIQKARYGEFIAVRIDVQPESEREFILKMLLQPLIENCFEHAFADRDSGRIFVQIKKEASTLQVIVEDDGGGYMEAEATQPMKKSIGLENVRSRIALHYGDASSMKIKASATGGTRVVLTLAGKVEDDDE